MLGETYRPLKRSDCKVVADCYNANIELPDPIWCATGETYNGDRIYGHMLYLLAKGRGRIISQVHRRNGSFLSYFGGYIRQNEAVYSIGITSLDKPDPMEIWRQDASYSFRQSLKEDIEKIKITSSSDQGQFVGWMENEVGMERDKNRYAWTANRQIIEDYLKTLPLAA